MLKYVLLLVNLIRAIVRDRETLVAENLLLRHQLAVLTRPTRRRPRLRARDKLFWVVVRALRRDWRRHLVLVRPRLGCGARSSRRPFGDASRGTCCTIEMPSMAVTSASAPDESVSMPLLRQWRALVRTPSSKDSLGHYVESVWTI